MGLLRDKKGVAGVVTAVSSVALVGAAAIGVDIGAVYLKSRQLQGAADLAAMAAAQELGNAQARATAAARMNGASPDARVSVTLGRYEPDPSRAPGQRFSPGGAANAARVRVEQDMRLFFGAMFAKEGKIRIGRTATAAQAQLASFQIGSRLLAVRGGLPNAVLSGLTGSEVSLSVMDYEALAKAEIDLFTYIDALRTEMSLTAATYDQVLATQIGPNRALQALARSLSDAGDAAGARAISALASAAGAHAPIDLSRLIDPGPYGAQDTLSLPNAARVRVNALDLANAVLQLANGERQVALDLQAGVPGLAGVKAWLAIGERPNASPWLAVTDDEDFILRTAQMRLYLEADIAAAGFANVRLPVLVELASAQARLAAIACGDTPRADQVTLSVAPSVGKLAIAAIDKDKLDKFKQPLKLKDAELLKTLLLRVEAFAEADLGGHEWQTVRFDGGEIADGAVKTVQTRDIVNASVATLLGDLELEVRTLGLGLDAGAVAAALRPPLQTAAPALDTLINGLTDLLGVHLGEADVRVNGVRCHSAALVG